MSTAPKTCDRVVDAPASAPSKCSAFWRAKIAFEIPGHYQRDGIYGLKYDDRLVDRLMGLFDDSEFLTENICNPALLIVNTDEMPTPEWIAASEARINAVLQNSDLSREGGK